MRSKSITAIILVWKYISIRLSSGTFSLGELHEFYEFGVCSYLSRTARKKENVTPSTESSPAEREESTGCFCVLSRWLPFSLFYFPSSHLSGFSFSFVYEASFKRETNEVFAIKYLSVGSILSIS